MEHVLANHECKLFNGVCGVCMYIADCAKIDAAYKEARAMLPEGFFDACYGSDVATNDQFK